MEHLRKTCPTILLYGMATKNPLLLGHYSLSSLSRYIYSPISGSNPLDSGQKAQAVNLLHFPTTRIR